MHTARASVQTLGSARCAGGTGSRAHDFSPMRHMAKTGGYEPAADQEVFKRPSAKHRAPRYVLVRKVVLVFARGDGLALTRPSRRQA